MSTRVPRLPRPLKVVTFSIRHIVPSICLYPPSLRLYQKTSKPPTSPLCTSSPSTSTWVCRFRHLCYGRAARFADSVVLWMGPPRHDVGL